MRAAGSAWTPTQDVALRLCWSRIPARVIADGLGRSLAAVRFRAVQLRLGPHRLDGPAGQVSRVAKLKARARSRRKARCRSSLIQVDPIRWLALYAQWRRG